MRKGWVRLTRRQAETWCIYHVHDDWYRLPLMLMAKGYNGDYRNFTEVGAESVYELEESGCFIVFPDWWSTMQLWKRDSVP
jgi:hypothetical protein